jgi:predicted 2-oxoglutarate/Fe(II)-dependent dioxygenase YbiX
MSSMTAKEPFILVPGLLNEETIVRLREYLDSVPHPAGKVGDRVDHAQKIRYDIRVRDKSLLTYLDNNIFNVIQQTVREYFEKEIVYREEWKLGYYKGSDNGFYRPHRDTQGLPTHREVSIVIAASDPSEYEGGELHFPELNREFKLEKGQAILFDSNTLHGVQPVTAGERIVLISFSFTEDSWNRMSEPKNKRNYEPHVQ